MADGHCPVGIDPDDESVPLVTVEKGEACAQTISVKHLKQIDS